MWPWKRTGRPRTTPWNSEDHQLTPVQRATESLCNFGSVLGSFISGALGGMAVITLMQIHLFNINNAVNGNDMVLVYYAPIALTVNRIYWGLTMIALASAVSRYGTGLVCITMHQSCLHHRTVTACRSAWMTIVLMPSEQSRESLRPMAGAIQSLALPTWSMVAVLAYLLAFVLNIATSGNDAELAYAVDRDPFFHSKPLPDEFRRRLVSWRAINTVKCILLLAAWVSVCKLPLLCMPGSLRGKSIHLTQVFEIMVIVQNDESNTHDRCRWFLSGSPEHWHGSQNRLLGNALLTGEATVDVTIPGRR